MGSLTADSAVPIASSADGKWQTAVERLVASAVLTGAVTRSRVASGPLMSRISLSSAAGEHLLLDVPRDPAVTAPAAGPEMSRLAGALQPDGDPTMLVRAVAAEYVETTPLSWYHRTPWPPVILAEVVTGGVVAPVPAPAAFAGLGGLLARLHRSGLPAEIGSPPPLRRVLAAADAGTVTAAQARLAARIVAWDGPVVPVHGQPALGHVLVPADGPGPGGAAVLTGWSEPLGGSAALDLGHLLGDMLEISLLIDPVDPAGARWLRARIGDVRRGYLDMATDNAPVGAPGERFWDTVSDGALLRVLDHRATLCGLLGPQAAPVQIADRVAGHLASPTFRQKGFRP